MINHSHLKIQRGPWFIIVISGWSYQESQASSQIWVEQTALSRSVNRMSHEFMGFYTQAGVSQLPFPPVPRRLRYKGLLWSLPNPQFLEQCLPYSSPLINENEISSGSSSQKWTWAFPPFGPALCSLHQHLRTQPSSLNYHPCDFR